MLDESTREHDFDTTDFPDWFRYDDGLVSDLHGYAQAMFSRHASSDMLPVTHPARRLVQSMVDGSERAGFNPMLLHQLSPKSGTDDPSRAVTAALAVLTMLRLSMERRINIAAAIIDEVFDVVDLPDAYRVIIRGASFSARVRAQT